MIIKGTKGRTYLYVIESNIYDSKKKKNSACIEILFLGKWRVHTQWPAVRMEFSEIIAPPHSPKFWYVFKSTGE